MIVAPDKFKGTLSAREAAEAIARGVREVHPSAELELIPLADGGDGTLSVLEEAMDGKLSYEVVPGPLGAPVEAPLCVLSNGDVVLEMALASGLAAIPRARNDALAASSEGTGGLIRAAQRLEPRRIIVGVGGSASTDGGTGAARAVGWRFVDGRGRDLGAGGGFLADLAGVEPPGELPHGVVGACDVASPLLGPAGTARLFAPQKGATAVQVQLLERAMERLHAVLLDDLGVDVDAVPGAGAGGGMGAGLLAFFGAELRPGFDLVADATDLRDRLRRASFVITGEGRIDEGTLASKVPLRVARLAQEAGIPCFAVAGEVALPLDVLTGVGFSAALGANEDGGRVPAHPREALAAATSTLLRTHALPG